MTPRIHSIKKKSAAILEVAQKRHRGGEAARRVVQGISDGMDGLLRGIFAEDLMAVARHVALVAVGGYGRRELCPYSDVDIMFLCDDLPAGGPVVEKVLRVLWDSGFQLGHSVRSPGECLDFMKEDDVTAATLLEARHLAGSEGLMRQFQEKGINRYKKLYGQHFAAKKLEGLRASLEGEGRTIFVTEPHIKEGMCCMRDVQHILWIERLRRDVLTIEDISQHGGFPFEEVRALEAAYSFYLRARCELHFLNGLRQDILSQDSQVDVARGLGYADAGGQSGVERLMSDYYRHASAVLNFARFYIETKSRGERFVSRLRHRFFSSRVSSIVSALDNRLYLTEEPELAPDRLAELIVKLFLMAQTRDADFSQSLCEWIRRKCAEQAPDFLRVETVYRAFFSILAGRSNAGRILTLMHQTGVLGRILPEFERLTCLVNFDGHHQFTVDEHTLRTLRELDRIESDPSYSEPEFRKVLEAIPDRLPLRLALLLHDIGKSTEGSHDAKGTEAAVVICRRLGLDEKTTEIVEFLVYRHLAMFRFSERMDFTEESVIARFASLVGDASRLDMLYLMTYIDIRSVGAGTWTAWKGAQLSELYHKTRQLLVTGKVVARTLEERLSAGGLEETERAALLSHCNAMASPTYAIDNIPERMKAHMGMVEKFRREGAIQVLDEEMVGCHQVTFCAPDRPHLFADLAGLLLSEGLSVVGARLYSRTDGVALDLFHVVCADKLRIDVPERVENLRRKLQRIEKGTVRIADLINDRWRRYRFTLPRKPLFPPRVGFHDDLSRASTVIEVDAGDRPGLLYDLATAIADLGLDLRTARVSTMIDRARDVFHVVDEDGGKVVSTQRRNEIAAALCRAAEWRDLSASGKETRIVF